MIIGITGTLAAGKGTIADLLIQKGFKHYSVRYFLTEEIKQRGLEVNRDNMVKVANELREQNSPNYIVENLYDKAKKAGGDCIIESIRNPGEVKALKSKGGFHLIAVDANVKIRYDRAIARASSTDKISFEEFVANEQREITSKEIHKQNLSKCVEMADFVIINNGVFEELNTRIEEIIKEVNAREHRPLWDEYFMEICKVVAKRSTCDRGKVGSVVAKDKRLIVTGYAGSPIGIPHCDEVGHQMKTMTHDDGSQTQHCVRTTHAEQNAICQAAKLGVSIDGATIYCKVTPCYTCAKMIVNAGIKRVVCEKKYHVGKESEELFKQAGIKLEFLNEEVEKYDNQ
jgi:dCMP deaminase